MAIYDLPNRNKFVLRDGITLLPTTHISNAGVCAQLKVGVYLGDRRIFTNSTYCQKKLIIEICKNQLVSVRKANAFLPPHCSYANPL